MYLNIVFTTTMNNLQPVTSDWMVSTILLRKVNYLGKQLGSYSCYTSYITRSFFRDSQEMEKERN